MARFTFAETQILDHVHFTRTVFNFLEFTEIIVLQLLIAGYSINDVARHLQTSRMTANRVRKRIRNKLTLHLHSN